MATYPVKYLHRSMHGAPVLTGTAGALISVLDACLIDGFGAVTLAAATVASGVATCTVNAGDSFADGDVVLVSGATPAALNGEHRVLPGPTNTSFQFATGAADGTATGAISAKYAPVGGWEKTYSGTNIAVYRSTDPLATGFYCRVDDTGTTMARVTGYVTMSDANTGTELFPTAAQIAGGGYWHKSNTADTVARPWRVAADSRLFYLSVRPYRDAYGSCWRGFGDMLPLAPGGDGWACALSASGNYAAIVDGSTEGGFDSAQMGPSSVYLPRGYQQAAAGAVASAAAPYTGSVANRSGSDATLGAYAANVSGALLLSRYRLDNPARAVVPGMYHIPQSGALAAISDGALLDATDDLAGRRLLAIGRSGQNYNMAITGVGLIDITGPWR